MKATVKDLRRKRNSIFGKLLLPMIIIAVLQCGVYLAILLGGGLSARLDQNAYGAFSRQVQNRNKEIETKMRSWSDLTDSSELIMSAYEDRGKISTSDGKKDFLLEISPMLVSLLRQNKVNGAYLILTDGQNTDESEGEELKRYGILIRDMDAEGGYRNDADLLIGRAPTTVANKIGYPLDTWWEAVYTLSDEDDFFFEPLKALKDNPGLSQNDYKYWSTPYSLSGSDTKMLSCSIPLTAGDSTVFAVLGIEVKTSYIENFLPYRELGYNDGGVYLLAKKAKDDYIVGAYSGFMASRYLTVDVENITKPENLTNNCYSVMAGEPLVACVEELSTYNKSSPFLHSPYKIIGMLSEDRLLSFSRGMRNSMLIALVISLFIAMVGAIAVSRIFSRPIQRLVAKVKTGKSTDKDLGRVNVYEIDSLISAIEELNRSVMDSELKTTEIIRMSGLLVGTFEFDRPSGKVFISPEFFDIMGGKIPRDCKDSAEFEKYLSLLESSLKFRDKTDDSKVYKFEESWIRLRITRGESRVLGIAMDITEEMNERKKIEYERDHDVLTELLNRRAFHKLLEEYFQAPRELGIAAILMLDVDNLKRVNDTYGHDCGDAYLKLVSNVIKSFVSNRIFGARISGDEFMMFFHGYENPDEVLEQIHSLKATINVSTMALPNGEVLEARVSGGIAFYIKDSSEQNSLMHFADFAMLQAKKIDKGSFRAFNLAEYRENKHMVESVFEITKLIETEAVDFHFQPIVDIRTCKIFAYEALMRPIGAINSPGEALSLAKAMGVLNKMERLTWFKALEKYKKHSDILEKDTMLFINSIPNQMLSKEDLEGIAARYESIVSRIVVEITEEEKADKRTNESIAALESLGIDIAIDDYGTGYNGQVMLLDFNPAYVKIDMSIVRGIDKDDNRKEIVASVLNYSKGRNIKIIAEGVETREELKTLEGLGIDYIQGYLLGRPAALPEHMSANALGIIESCRN